jgi:hypothetical protein
MRSQHGAQVCDAYYGAATAAPGEDTYSVERQTIYRQTMESAVMVAPLTFAGRVRRASRRLASRLLTLWACLVGVVGIGILGWGAIALLSARSPTAAEPLLMLSSWLLAFAPRLGQVWRWFTTDDIIGADWIWRREHDEWPWQSPAWWSPPPPAHWSWGSALVALWSTGSIVVIALWISASPPMSFGTSVFVAAVLLAVTWAVWPRWARLVPRRRTDGLRRA